MPTVEENKAIWDGSYHWRDGGNKWSESWGDPAMQWHATILPRIYRFVPTTTILEIGPGFGRWTAFLAGLCDRLILVDLSTQCINACRERFGEGGKISYHVNDGRSLAMVPDESVDFVFSYDSLVHAEADVLSEYLHQLARKLKPGGVGFFHHSNAGQYAAYFKVMGRVRRVRPLKFLFRLFGINLTYHKRALSMTAEAFQRMAADAGLCCLSQELINWRSPFLLDCHSVVARLDHQQPQACRRLENDRFMEEAELTARLAPLYSDFRPGR